jgi:hypothetical protein
MLLLSSAGYAYFDKGFVINAYVWLAVWYVFFTFEGVWVKHMVRAPGRGPLQGRAGPCRGGVRSVAAPGGAGCLLASDGQEARKAAEGGCVGRAAPAPTRTVRGLGTFAGCHCQRCRARASSG